MFQRNNTLALVAALAGAATLFTSANAANAASIASGTSTAYGASANVSAALSLVQLNVAPTGQSTGNAPAVYNVSSSVPITASATLGIPGLNVSLASVNGLLNSNATSNVDGLAGLKTTSSSTSIANLNIALGSTTLPILGTTSALSLTGSVISSNASVMSDGTSFSTSGSSSLAGLTIKVGTSVLNLSTYLNAQGQFAPNTTLGVNALGVAGLEIILNEQTPTANGISVNAIHIEADALASNSLNLGVLDADIIIGHSDAYEFAGSGTGNTPAATPLPDAAGLGMLGLAGSSAFAAFRRKLRPATI